MIEITVRYNDRLRSIHFPCSENELTSAFTEIHAMSDTSELLVTEREFDRKNQSSRHKKPSCILESEKTEGFLGRKE